MGNSLSFLNALADQDYSDLNIKVFKIKEINKMKKEAYQKAIQE